MKTMFVWIQLNNLPNSNPMMSVIFPHRIGENWKYQVYQKQLPKGAQACNFFIKVTLAQVPSCEFCKISKNTFSDRTLPKAASILWRSSFIFSRWMLSSFQNFMKTSANLTKATLRETWHSMSKICKITGKKWLKIMQAYFFIGN